MAMKGQKYKKDNLDNWKNDCVYTPEWLAKRICERYPLSGIVLEPCKGKGSFLKYMPEGSEWCEILEGKDFYDYCKNVNWIVTNPPYSQFDKFLEKCFSISDNVVLLVPCSKIFTSIGKLRTIFNYGGFVEFGILPSGKAGFPFGFPSGVFYFKKGYKGETKIYMFECE